MKTLKFVLGKVLSLLVAAAAAVMMVGLWKTQMLPELVLGVVGALLALLTALVLVLTWTGRGKVRMTVGIVLAVLMLGVEITGSVYIWQGLNTLDNITSGNTETVHMGIYMRSDDARSFDDVSAASYQYGILQEIDREATDGAVQQLNQNLNTQITLREYERPADLVEALLGGEVDAIILNEALLDLLRGMGESYKEKLDRIREAVLHKVEVPVESKPVNPPTTEATQNPEGTQPDATKPDDPVVDPPKSSAFAVYISGIDTRGNVSVRSCSDVNILAVVNPDTRQVLLVSTPRDFYVPISSSSAYLNGKLDKLTHAGLGGINSSRETVGALYGINIDYHFKVNFSGFEKIIDALGGITVYSEYTFGEEDNGEYFSFQKGENQLDGHRALAFCRIRKAFADGDNQRGKNQMAVIKAVINKALSPKLLTNYTQILKSVESSVEMSIPTEVIGNLVSRQLSEGGSWNVVSYSVRGTNGWAPSPLVSGELSVIFPDQKTVDHAKQLIKDVIDGKTVTP